LLLYCDADKHTVGSRIDYGMHTQYRRTLIDDANKVPKNYTIIYKYYGAVYKEVAYLEIDVNVKSSGYLNASNNKKLIEGQIDINNALNVTATITIYGYGIVQMPSFHRWLRNDYITKSLTYIYKKNYDSNQVKQFAQNSIGRRREGDELIHFQSRNVTNASRFPSRAFEYSGTEYITYAGFSFNSPTAMVMINTSYVGEKEFNAVVYDMSTEHFVANISVYGIRSAMRPDQFEGVI